MLERILPPEGSQMLIEVSSEDVGSSSLEMFRMQLNKP